MLSTVEKSRVLEYLFVIHVEICLLASLQQPSYTEQNDSALRIQQHTRRQIDSTAGVK